MTRLAITLLIALTLAGCSDNIGARRALADAGYTDIELTGYRIFGCSDDDQFRTGFRAKSPAGRRVSGVVCAGWMKGNTIRTD